MGGDGGDSPYYCTGIHILKSYEDAVEYLDNFRTEKDRVIVKCKAKGIWEKPTNTTAYLANWLYIPQEEIDKIMWVDDKVNLDNDYLEDKAHKIHYKEMDDELSRFLSEKTEGEDIAFLCIGTDRSTGDSLGPLVGSELEELGYEVYGTLENLSQATNLEERVEEIPDEKYVIAIDAGLGKSNSIGKIIFEEDSLKPGSGVNKNLGEFGDLSISAGDLSISAIVNISGYMEYFVLQSTKLSLVLSLVEVIVDQIKRGVCVETRKETACL